MIILPRTSLAAILGLLLAGSMRAAAPRPFLSPDRIRYDAQCLTIDGKDAFIYSGSFHYFRCPKELWRDRFQKIKEAGFNTVETYTPWNWHEREMPKSPDDFSQITSLKDLDDWLTLAEDFGLNVIVRPGPYICAEWDNGGFPLWLSALKTPAAPLHKEGWMRSDDPVFLAWSKHWFDVVCPIIAKHQITRKAPGKPGVILVQVENEYDSAKFSDAVKINQIKALAQFARADGIDVPLITCWTKQVRESNDPELRQIFDCCNFYPRWNVSKELGTQIPKLRREQPDAGGLVIATDQEHARGIATILRMRFGTTARVVTSDDPAASAGIASFAAGSEPWLVAVRMVSEGVDIPRLRVGVYATTTATELFFRQAVGRLVRWTRGIPRQRAWLFIPDDPRLRLHAARVAEQRRHSLRRDDRERPERDDEEQVDAVPEDEQLSLFAAISAVATAAAGLDEEAIDDLDDADDDGDGFELTLAPPPPLAGAGAEAGGVATLTRREEKQQLRDANAAVARELVRRTGLTHAQVNAELNRRCGLQRVAQATLDQLRRRLVAADEWLVKS